MFKSVSVDVSGENGTKKKGPLSLIIILIPVIGVLILIGALTYYIRKTKQEERYLFRAISPELHHSLLPLHYLAVNLLSSLD